MRLSKEAMDTTTGGLKTDNGDLKEPEGTSEKPKDLKEELDDQEIEAINDLERLLELYTGTLGRKDLIIFDKLKQRENELDPLPAFGPKRNESIHQFSNPLSSHTARSNIVLSSLSDNKAFASALEYEEADAGRPGQDKSEFYDLRFMLPILCNAIDETNVFDPLRVINNGWVYFVMRGISFKCDVLRNIALLSYKRMLFGLLQPKYTNNGTVKLWVHFLLSVKRGISQQMTCHVTNLLSTWLVAAWEVVKKPSHSLFHPLTKFLLAKPIVEMTILPEFIAFYNASDGNKESREWVLNIMYCGLKTEEDWKLVMKLPAIKFLCSSFLLEKMHMKKNIVGILNRGANIREVANLLVDKYSLPLWLSNICTTNKNLQHHLRTLFTSLKSNSDETKTRSALFKYVEMKMNVNLASRELNGPDKVEAAAEDDEEMT